MPEQDKFTEAFAMLERNDLTGALATLTALRTEVLAHEGIDPDRLGWVRFGIFKCLYLMQRYDEARQFFKSRETVHYMLSTSNIAWMYSVCTELAYRANDVEDVVVMSEKCVAARNAAGQAADAERSAKNAVLMLRKLGRDDLAAKFTT